MWPKFPDVCLTVAAPWRKRLNASLTPLGSRVHVSVTPRGLSGGGNGVRMGFSWDFSRFPLPQISFYHFSTLTSFIWFHLESSEIRLRKLKFKLRIATVIGMVSTDLGHMYPCTAMCCQWQQFISPS